MATARNTTAQVPKAPEEDLRVQIFNAFMVCPHRDTDKIAEIHKEIQEKDPLFYAHLACWYRLQHDVMRDHVELFTAHLITDAYQPNREVGLALFREQPPFLKKRILGYIKGKKVKLRVKTGKKIQKDKKSIDEIKIEDKHVGLNKSLPTAFKTDVQQYLRWLEAHPEKFDEVALRSGKDLKSLYASNGLQIKPCARAQKILFEKEYPEDSKLKVLEQITKAKTPEEAATLIVEQKIPYTVAVGLVAKITPTILVALINQMSSQELINNIASLQEKGAMDNPEVKKLIEAKLKKAETAKGVSTLKSKTAKATGRVTDVEISAQLDKVSDKQVMKSGTIKVPTAIFVDKSGSMDVALKVGKSCAALVSGVTTAPLHVICFDTMAILLTTEDKTLTGWEKAFKPITANGSTSIGVALDYLIRKNIIVEQIIIITDEGENQAPYFHDVYPKYVAALKVTPAVVVINMLDTGLVPVDHTFTRLLTSAKIPFDVYKPAGADYYGLPGLVTLLSRKSKLDLIYEIMDVPLMTRKAFR